MHHNDAKLIKDDDKLLVGQTEVPIQFRAGPEAVQMKETDKHQNSDLHEFEKSVDN